MLKQNEQRCSEEDWPWKADEQSLQAIRSSEGANTSKASKTDKKDHFEITINFRINLSLFAILPF